MKEKQEDHKINLSNRETEFLNLVMTDPESVFKTLNDKDLIKPFVFRDLIENGGKLGSRGIARKYNMTHRESRTLISKIRENVKKWSE